MQCYEDCEEYATEMEKKEEEDLMHNDLYGDVILFENETDKDLDGKVILV